MNRPKELQLAAFFEELIEAETAFQNIKQNLYSNSLFNSSALFRLISMGFFITIDKFRQYLESRLDVTQRQLYQLFCRFDWSRNGRISLHDFTQQLKPYNGKRLAQDNNCKVTPEIESVFLKLLREYIERWRICEICRQQLSYLIPYQAFDSVAVHKKGYIGKDDIRSFMGRLDIELNNHQLDLLLYALKRRHYAKVTLEVFSQNLWPVEFGYYSGFQNELLCIQENQYRVLNREGQEIARKEKSDQYRLVREQMKHQRRIHAKLAEDLDRSRHLHDVLLSRKVASALGSRLPTEPVEILSNLTHKTNRIQDTPSFSKKDNPYLIDAARKSVELERQRLLHNDIVSNIEQQKHMRLAHLEITNSILKNRAQQLDLMNYRSENKSLHRPILDQSGQQTSKQEFNPKPITQETDLTEKQSRYSFGAQHLRVYRPKARDATTRRY